MYNLQWATPLNYCGPKTKNDTYFIQLQRERKSLILSFSSLFNITESNIQSIKHAAIASNVSLRSGLYSNSAQLGHGSHKGLLKGSRVLGPDIDGGLGPPVGEEDLV